MTCWNLPFMDNIFLALSELGSYLISLNFHFSFGSMRTMPPAPTSCSKIKSNLLWKLLGAGQHIKELDKDWP